jgi:hypothetical protein
VKNLQSFKDFLNENSQNINLAYSKIDELPKGKLFNDAKNIEKIFKMSKHSWNEVIVAYEQNEEQHHIVYVNISEIHITQPNVQSGKVMKMIDDIKKVPRINVVQFPNGEKSIYDGHHRLIAHWALGESKIKVNLVKI